MSQVLETYTVVPGYAVLETEPRAFCELHFQPCRGSDAYVLRLVCQLIDMFPVPQ